VRSLATLLFVLTMAFAQQPRSWIDATPSFYGPPTGGWQLALFSEKQSFFSGEPARIMLYARNGSARRLRVAVPRSPWFKGEFEIKRLSDGQVVQPRPSADEFDLLRRGAGGSQYFQVEPGHLVAPGLVNLQQIFDLKPGAYTVAATCDLPAQDAATMVKVPSNQITISIVQRP
jgi:hypothetical protein